MFGWRKSAAQATFPGNLTFTDRTRRVLMLAREEAASLQHDYVGTEHLLLALVREEEGPAVKVLRNLAVTPEAVRARMEAILRRGKAEVGDRDLPYTSRSKKVLEFTMDEARRLSHSYVGTEHLLLGLLREEKGIAAEVLRELGAPYERVRRETLRLLGEQETAETAVDGEGSGFMVAIDDASDASIYEQIVAQVQEAVATGRLQPGERLPPVRRLADQIDIAPGTVARAYSELERLGVVVTEGARGTRIAQRKRSPQPEAERPETLVGLLRPVAVAAFHLGATAAELRQALEEAMRDIFGERDGSLS